MTYINKQQKNNKYSKEYNDIVKSLAAVLNNTKKQQLNTLIDEIGTLSKDKNTLDKDLNSKVNQVKYLKSTLLHAKGADREIARITALGANGQRQMGNFIGERVDGITTDYYRGEGWFQLVANYYANLGDNDNLYSVKEQSFQITEDQVIKTLARVIYELGQIDTADFVAKHGLTGTDKTQMESYLNHLRGQSQAIKEMNSKDGKDLEIKTWDLPQTYTHLDNYGARISTSLNLEHTFNFIKKVSDSLLTNLKQDNITALETWKIAKAGDAYTEAELTKYGVPVPNNFILYKSGKVEGGQLFQDFHEVEVAGLKGWVNLAKLVLENEDNQKKLIKSLTNSPTQDLFADLRSTRADGHFEEGGHWHRLTESVEDLEELKEQIEVDKTVGALEVNELNKEIRNLQQQSTGKRTTIIDKEKTLQPLITETLTKLRTELKKFTIEKGLKKVAGGDDNRKSVQELIQLEMLLLNIRYLENEGDATLNSKVAQENTTLTEIEQILEKVTTDRYCSLVQIFQNLGYKKGGEVDINQAISKIKTGKWDDNQEVNIYVLGLEQFLTNFQNKEKLVKLSDWELEARKALEKELGKEDNMNETLTDWQTKLKKLDPALDASVITEEFKTKWGEVAKHQTIAQVEALLKKVIGTDGKIKQSFLDEIKKSDATLADLKTLLGKEPKDVITYIARFEFNNLSDSGKDKDKAKTQMIRKLKKALSKEASHTLTDEEINDALYKVEVGELTLNTKSLKEDLTEYTTAEETKAEEGHFQKHGMKYLIGGGVLVVIGLIVFVCWDKITKWWDDREEDEVKSR